MQDIVKWLIETEKRAQNIYESSATIISEDEELYNFLIRLSNEEKTHSILINKAYELIKGRSDLPTLVYLDNDAKQKVDNHFLICEQKIRTNKLTNEDIIDFIVSTEYSESNDLFIYVMNSLKHHYREFIPPAANIQRHKRNIEQFLELRPEFAKYLEAIKKIPSIWKEKILVVDDQPFIVDVVTAFLGDEGVIDNAANGEEALKKLGDAYYAAVITDVDMPVMTGIEFYKKAIEKYPNIKHRFLFFTGLLDEEHLSFFKQNNLQYLLKPSGISEIKRVVLNILYQVMSVDSIMTHRVVTVEMDDTVLIIRGLFKYLKFHHLLVVENRKLVGVISDRDLLRALSPFLGTPSETTHDRDTLNRRAHQIMSRHPVVIHPETEIKTAANLLFERNISCLPVVTHEGDIVGIVTRQDILKYYLDSKVVDE